MSGTVFLSGTQFSVLETDTSLSVAIERTGDSSLPIDVEYAITINPQDPQGASTADVGTGTFVATIAAGEPRIVLDIPMTDDDLAEGTESFTISIISVSSGTLLFPRTARVDILDDELPEVGTVEPPLVSDYEVVETDIYSVGDQPIGLEFSPVNPNYLYVGEKAGLITVFDVSTDTKVGDLIDLSAEVNAVADRGLLDIALHPDFATNPYLYAFYVVDPPETANETGLAGVDGSGNRFSHLVRFTLDQATGYTSVVPDSKVVLLGTAGQSLSDISGGGAIDSTLTANVGVPDSEIDALTGEFKRDYLKVDATSHAGGALEFGPDGALYVSVGDGTSFNLADPRSVSVQDINSLSGKILRVDPLTGQGLADNPFVAEAGGDLDANAAKVFQLGLRNPFSMAFDDDGELFITNTGWFSYESVFTGGPGANFGWPYLEGGDNGTLLQAPLYNLLPSAAAFYAEVDAGTVDITAPYRSFSHEASDPGFEIQAITGAGSVIASDTLPASLQGHYIFTDVVSGEVFSVSTDDRRDINYLYDAGAFAPVNFKEGPDGNLYYADLIGGKVGRLQITQEEVLFEFNNSTYFLGTDGLTRAEAEAEALALGGTLLRVDSQAEQDYIMQTFWNDQAIYLDASDALVEGVWVDSNGNNLSYTNWSGGGPDNGSGAQHWAVIARESGRWDDQRVNGASINDGTGWVATQAMTIIEISEAPEEFTFGDSVYMLGTPGLTRADAQAEAAAAGGTLLRINSQGEQDFIMQTFWRGEGIYLDASDQAVEGVWLDSSGNELTYTNWGGSGPDNGGGAQHWAVIARPSGNWDDQRENSAGVNNGNGWAQTKAMTIIEINSSDEFRFENSTYVPISTRLTRSEAEAEAAARGGTLLRVDSQAEQDWIMQTFWQDRAIYLDASDALVEGNWVNSDGVELTYTNWSGSGPDNAGGAQHWAVIARASGTWDDQRINGASIFADDRWTPTDALTIIEIVDDPIA
ncbi:MAG: PQQ-dependent sugar dehydrogenase [Pseudomonadota bacterium]